MAPMFIQVGEQVIDVSKVTHISPVWNLVKHDAELPPPTYEVCFVGGTSTVLSEHRADQLLNEIAALGRGNVLICRKAV